MTVPPRCNNWKGLLIPKDGRKERKRRREAKQKVMIDDSHKLIQNSCTEMKQMK